MPLVGAHIPRNSFVSPGDQQEQPQQHNIILDDMMRNVTSSGRDGSGVAREIPAPREEPPPGEASGGRCSFSAPPSARVRPRQARRRGASPNALERDNQRSGDWISLITGLPLAGKTDAALHARGGVGGRRGRRLRRLVGGRVEAASHSRP